MEAASASSVTSTLPLRIFVLPSTHTLPCIKPIILLFSMKTISLKKIMHIAAAMTASLCGLASVSSCSAIMEDDPVPCEQGISIQFIYEYNLERADAFNAQVDCLTLHIYDSDGNYLMTRSEKSDVLKNKNYCMNIDLPEGDYRLIAYGGVECDKASFSHTAVPAEGSKDSDLGMKLNDKCLIPGNASGKLHDHFYGSLNVKVNKTVKYQLVQVPMMKNTNHFRIMLQHLSYEPLDGNDYEFSIIDDNTLFDHNNDLIDNGLVSYTPWDKGKIVTGSAEIRDDEPVRSITDVQMAYADMSTSRLMLKRNPKLVVKHIPSDTEIINIPLNNYLLAFKSGYFSWAGDQEFLDRKSDWQLFFFLDKANHWAKVYIRVDNWIVRINDIEMN